MDNREPTFTGSEIDYLSFSLQIRPATFHHLSTEHLTHVAIKIYDNEMKFLVFPFKANGYHSIFFQNS